MKHRKTRKNTLEKNYFSPRASCFDQVVIHRPRLAPAGYLLQPFTLCRHIVISQRLSVYSVYSVVTFLSARQRKSFTSAPNLWRAYRETVRHYRCPEFGNPKSTTNEFPPPNPCHQPATLNLQPSNSVSATRTRHTEKHT